MILKALSWSLGGQEGVKMLWFCPVRHERVDLIPYVKGELNLSETYTYFEIYDGGYIAKHLGESPRTRK